MDSCAGVEIIPIALFIIMGLALCLVYYRATKDKETGFNFTSLWTTNEKADVFKFVYFHVAIAMVWVLFFLAITKNLTEWYVGTLVFGIVLGSGASEFARRWQIVKTTNGNSKEPEK